MSTGTGSYIRTGWIILALVFSALAPANVAKAEIISLSAASFHLQCPPTGCASAAADFEFNNGLLLPGDFSRFFASVPFPTNGQKVCSFSLVYQDINNNDPLVARLLRKPFSVGSNPTAAPIVMATVNSAVGVVSSVRIATTTAITQPTIVKGNGFYIAEVFAETINLNFLGVLIDYRPTCP